MASRFGRYSHEEVESLVEGYEELRQARDTSRRGLRILHGLLDMDRALRALTHKQRQVVVLSGLLGFNYRQAAELLGISPSTARRRYLHTLESLTEIMNRGGR